MMGLLDDLPGIGFGDGDKRPRPPAERAVVHTKIVCRECGFEDVPVYKSEPPIRRYKCPDCGHTFKSVERKVKG
jgi:DNA-directed RNA polymerase subunit RPC12/RpoP